MVTPHVSAVSADAVVVEVAVEVVKEEAQIDTTPRYAVMEVLLTRGLVIAAVKGKKNYFSK